MKKRWLVKNDDEPKDGVLSTFQSVLIDIFVWHIPVMYMAVQNAVN